MADSPATAAHRFTALAGGLSASTFFIGVHRDIGTYGKRVAQQEGGVMRPWSKKAKGRRTVKLGARYDATERSVKVKPTPPGLWAIREKGAKRHAIPKTAKRRNQGRTVLMIGQEFRAKVEDASARPRPAWEDVRSKLQRESGDIVNKAVRKAMAKAFSGSG